MAKWLIGIVGVLVFAGLLAWRLNGPVQEPASDIETLTTPPETRDAKARPHSEVPLQPEVADDPPQPDVTTLTDKTSAQAALLALFVQLEGPMREWAATRGLPLSDANGNFVLEQPYQQYDNETLLALADNGDMWAQQILAERIASTRPAEAMELYRRAAARGSIFAMLQLSQLADTIAESSSEFDFEQELEGADSIALEQFYSLRDAAVPPKVNAFAWRAVAEMAGLPGFSSISRSQWSLPDEELAAACDLAGSIYSDLLARRSSLGLGAYPSDTPPAWFDGNALGMGPSCEHPQAIEFDLSACREIRYEPPDGERSEGAIYVCDGS